MQDHKQRSEHVKKSKKHHIAHPEHYKDYASPFHEETWDEDRYEVVPGTLGRVFYQLDLKDQTDDAFVYDDMLHNYDHETNGPILRDLIVMNEMGPYDIPTEYIDWLNQEHDPMLDDSSEEDNELEDNSGTFL